MASPEEERAEERALQLRNLTKAVIYEADGVHRIADWLRLVACLVAIITGVLIYIAVHWHG